MYFTKLTDLDLENTIFFRSKLYSYVLITNKIILKYLNRIVEFFYISY